MKKHITLIAFSLITASAFAQVLNPSFETWSSGSPSSWTSSNVAGIFNNVQESSDAHAGSKAADLTVGSFSGNYVGGIVFQQDVAYSGAAQNVTVWYKGVLSADAFLSIVLTYSDENDNVLYAGASTISTSAANYTAGVVQPESVSSGTIAKMGLTISLSLSSNTMAPAGNPHVIVDDVQFGGVVSTQELDAVVTNLNVYPNPTSENCTISIDAKDSQLTAIQVYDMQGKLIHSENKMIVAGSNLMDLNMSNYEKGLYTIILDANGKRTSKQIVKL